MLADEDKRVLPAVAARPRAAQGRRRRRTCCSSRVKDLDFSVRAAVSELIGEVKPQGGADALREAYKVAAA